MFIDLLELARWEVDKGCVMGKKAKFFKSFKLINIKTDCKFIMSRYEGNHQMSKTANEVK